MKKVLLKNKRKHPIKHETHPRFRQTTTFGEKASDFVARFGGSWKFLIILSSFLVLWMILNTWVLVKGFDYYPFILLNLVLSCLAAFQAPIILMAQNRQGHYDRIDANYDHAINRKAEREIQRIMKDLNCIKRKVKEIKNIKG